MGCRKRSSLPTTPEATTAAGVATVKNMRLRAEGLLSWGTTYYYQIILPVVATIIQRVTVTAQYGAISSSYLKPVYLPSAVVSCSFCGRAVPDSDEHLWKLPNFQGITALVSQAPSPSHRQEDALSLQLNLLQRKVNDIMRWFKHEMRTRLLQFFFVSLELRLRTSWQSLR